MKTLILILLTLITLTAADAQGNHVFSGGEITNYAVVDISPVAGLTWSTERNALPGYYSVIDTATYTGCTDAANIDGYIKKYGNRAFIFPVGSGNDLRTLEISAPAALTDAYATAWLLGDPDSNLDLTSPNAGPHPVLAVTAPLLQVSSIGQWDWQVGDAGNLGSGTTGTGDGLRITVSMPDMSDFALTQDLRLAGWNGHSWIDLSGTATATGNTENNTLTGTMQAGITAVAIASIAKTRPFTITGFTATPLNCNAVIKWKTSTEINVNRFIIEKSFDDINFSIVASVIAGGSASGNSYTISTAQANGKAYYRIRIIHNDGSITTSSSVACLSACNVTEYMQVYPNPVSEYQDLYLSFGTVYRGKALIVIFNAIGQKILEKNILVSTDINLVPVDLRRYAAGGYFMSLLSEQGKLIGSVQKFIKQ